MDGVLRPDLGTLFQVGLVAFIVIWGANRVLRYAGYPQWTTAGQ